MIEKLGLLQPRNATARSAEKAVELAKEIGYPLVVRPSYVLGGRAMEIVYKEDELRHYMKTAVQVSDDSPVLLDFFLPNAIEMDVDAVSDGEQVVIGAIMQHIEQAGIHSGDSACSLPPYSLAEDIQNECVKCARKMALELGVRGSDECAVGTSGWQNLCDRSQPHELREQCPLSPSVSASRWRKLPPAVWLVKLSSHRAFTKEIIPPYFSVKEAVFPFNKFPGIDPILGPEMKSTGEVMGVGATFAEAYGKARTGCQ